MRARAQARLSEPSNIEASACSAQSTALGYGDSRPQRTGAARPSVVGITASSVVTKIVDKSIIAILVLESHRYLAA